MKLAIMQPYFFPYIGYFQLLNHVDEFIIYDNIQYTKKGWINRNRILVNGKDEYITLPLKKDSDFLNVNERNLSDSWTSDRLKLMNKLRESYRKAPFFEEVFPLLEKIILFSETNLFLFICNSIHQMNEFLGIKTPVLTSSAIQIDHALKSERKVIELCLARKANVYVNPIGGLELYNKDVFKNRGIDLKFLKTNNFEYKQFDNKFLPFLSIIDVIMFNSKESVNYHINNSFNFI